MGCGAALARSAASLARKHFNSTSTLGERHEEYPLDSLDSAELERTHTAGEGRSTSKVVLVFRNTRPATRVALSRWSVAGSGPGDIANQINDWLRQNAS